MRFVSRYILNGSPEVCLDRVDGTFDQEGPVICGFGRPLDRCMGVLLGCVNDNGHVGHVLFDEEHHFA